MLGFVASFIIPFPYAGMTQFRFEGFFSAPRRRDTPNGTMARYPSPDGASRFDPRDDARL